MAAADKNGERVEVAVDGPSASGKSSVSRSLAKRLHFVYVDSGALYRAITWSILARELSPGNLAGVTALLAGTDIEPCLVQGSVRYMVDGVDPGEDLRSDPVVERVSDVAAIPEVRSFIVEHLRDAVRFGSLVMEGRDIGSVVFPDTPHKFYLDADPAERARRRFHEDASRRGGGGLNAVRDSLDRRDRKDASREISPLQVAEGAQVINTTGMTLDEVVARIEVLMREAT